MKEETRPHARARARTHVGFNGTPPPCHTQRRCAVQGDLATAHSCFESAQKARANKVSLRQLSMLTRQMAVSAGGPAAAAAAGSSSDATTTATTTATTAAAAAAASARATERSLAHAKAALVLDWEDPESWCVTPSHGVSQPRITMRHPESWYESPRIMVRHPESWNEPPPPSHDASPRSIG